MTTGGAFVDPRAVMAAGNNADWYTMMFDVHGLGYERTDECFRAVDPPPPYHSWMTIFSPEPGPATLGAVEAESGRHDFGIKDSFRQLELRRLGLVELFAATWIWCERPSHDVEQWRRIESVSDLERWESAWKQGGSPSNERQFPESILNRSDVTIFGRAAGTGFDAGAIANVSTDCVGMSNVFGIGAVGAAATLCSRVGGARPVVGYEGGDDLAQALDVGFEAVGELRICVKQS